MAWAKSWTEIIPIALGTALSEEIVEVAEEAGDAMAAAKSLSTSSGCFSSVGGVETIEVVEIVLEEPVARALKLA